MVSKKVSDLCAKGARIHAPESVYIDDAIDLERISEDCIIYPGSRILGNQTSIGPGSILGSEAPVTLENTQLGANVELKGGYVSGAVFLSGANAGSGAHVRPGTLLEEEASIAHSVGLKQTIFLSYVTAGSLINFCDAFMAGGTSRKNHSEIGSSYIHFNFTPHGDKATASLVGDVPRGVMLDQPPIFLGGQGGLAGPVRVEYGSVIAAGVICRKDVLKSGLYMGGALPAGGKSVPYPLGVYRNVGRIISNGLTYIGNILALEQWYGLVRASAVSEDPFSHYCHDGALRQIAAVIKERIKRMEQLAENLKSSAETLKGLDAESHASDVQSQEHFSRRWPELKEKLIDRSFAAGDTLIRDGFLSAWEKAADVGSFTDTVKSLDKETREQGRRWLKSIVDTIQAL